MAALVQIPVQIRKYRHYFWNFLNEFFVVLTYSDVLTCILIEINYYDNIFHWVCHQFYLSEHWYSSVRDLNFCCIEDKSNFTLITLGLCKYRQWLKNHRQFLLQLKKQWYNSGIKAETERQFSSYLARVKFSTPSPRAWSK